MTRLISGPMNVVRLEGKVFGIKKILYLFFDIHMPCNDETKCGDIFAKNVTRYFIDQFQNSNKDKIYDFFLETSPSRLKTSSRETDHHIYIQEMRDLMAKIITYEKKTNRLSSKIFPNIRLHYMDVRDYLYEDIFYYQIYDLVSICRDIYIKSIDNRTHITVENINFFDNEIRKFYDNISHVYDAFFSGQKGGRIIEPDITPETATDIFSKNKKYLIDKIKNRYTHPEIKTAIKKILDEQLRKSLEYMLDKILLLRDLMNRLKEICNIPTDQLNSAKETYSKYSKFSRNIDISYGPNTIDTVAILADIYSLISTVKETSEESGSVIMDVYFLRRFLDKDYITNGISYTGALHSLNYIDILVNVFNFKITHASYSKYDIPQLNEKIHEADIKLSQLIMPLQVYQCSDVSSFPQGFD